MCADPRQFARPLQWSVLAALCGPQTATQCLASVRTESFGHGAHPRPGARCLDPVGRKRCVDSRPSVVASRLASPPMARLIQENIKQPLAEELLFGKLTHGGHVVLSIVDGKIAFENHDYREGVV